MLAKEFAAWHNQNCGGFRENQVNQTWGNGVACVSFYGFGCFLEFAAITVRKVGSASLRCSIPC